MKAFRKSRLARTTQAGLILLFAEKFGPAERDHDERIQTGILTSGFILAPAFPVAQSS